MYAYGIMRARARGLSYSGNAKKIIIIITRFKLLISNPRLNVDGVETEKRTTVLCSASDGGKGGWGGG